MSTKPSSPTRLIAIDVWRGLAIIGMIIFHAFLILDFLGVVHYAMYSGWWLLMANTVRTSFLMVVGIALVIAFKGKKTSPKDYYITQIKRATGIGLIAMMITLITWFAIPKMFVSFGILHHIAVGIVLALPFIANTYLARFTLLLSVVISVFISGISSSSTLLHILGAQYSGFFSSMDFIPIFPWFIALVLGVVCGQSVVDTGMFRRINSVIAGVSLSKIPATLGRYSLRLYVFHVPVLVFIFIATGLVDIRSVFPGLF